MVIFCSYGVFKDFLEEIETNGGGMDNFTQAYNYYGMHVLPNNAIVCREWAPGAKGLFLTGQFSKISIRI